MTIPPDLPETSFLIESRFRYEDLDGHSIDELSDYLDAGMVPADPSIDASPACQLALDALTRVRSASSSLLEIEASNEPAVEDSWLAGILGSISLDAHAGREIPISHPSPEARIIVTEGAIRGLIRSAGDTIDGLLVGRSTLIGDVTGEGAPITVHVDASVYWGERIPNVVSRLRDAISDSLIQHTELNVVGIDITVHDLFLRRNGPAGVEE